MPSSLEIIESSLPALRRLQLRLRSGTFNNAIGQSVVKLLQEHFRARPANKRNFPTTYFWQRAAAATSFASDAASIRVSVNQTGVRQRLLGGPIIPIKGKFLTIPAVAEACGHCAADFGPLKIARIVDSSTAGSHWSLGLVPQNLPVSKSDPARASSVLFWLTRSVLQLPDPTVLPTNNEIHATVTQAVAAAVK